MPPYRALVVAAPGMGMRQGELWPANRPGHRRGRPVVAVLPHVPRRWLLKRVNREERQHCTEDLGGIGTRKLDHPSSAAVGRKVAVDGREHVTMAHLREGGEQPRDKQWVDGLKHRRRGSGCPRLAQRVCGDGGEVRGQRLDVLRLGRAHNAPGHLGRRERPALLVPVSE